MERPTPDTERTRVTPGMPFMMLSIGNVTSCSTSCGARPFGLRHQRDDGTVEVGKDIDRDARQEEAAVTDQYQRRRQNEDAVAQAGRDQEIEH